MSNTFSIEENARESKRLHALLDNGIAERLKSYPGVRHVSAGLRTTGNELVWERCFLVYVDKKKRRDQLKEGEIIPPEIDGIKTDVHEMSMGFLAGNCTDSSRYRPIKGGIYISNGLEILDSATHRFTTGFGTLGAIGRVKGRCKCNTMALTNWHVIFIPQTDSVTEIKPGTRIFQPNALSATNGRLDPLPDPDTEDNDIGKIVDGILTDTVDCGLIEINRSCCNCCGVPYENTIKGLEVISPLISGNITGSNRAHPGDRVFFVGASSGANQGVVVDDNAHKQVSYPRNMIGDPAVLAAHPGDPVAPTLINQLSIRPQGNFNLCNGTDRFVDHGDSGSLLVNERNEAVGLIFATDDPPVSSAPFLGYANHYENVIAALNAKGYDFELNYTPLSTGGSRGEPFVVEGGSRATGESLVVQGESLAVGDVDGTSPDGQVLADDPALLEWQRRINANPKTRAIYSALQRHRDEVLLLVNHHRPVTVGWHRKKGPAFTNILFRRFNSRAFDYPTEVKGVTVEELLSTMRDLLLAHGSTGLKEDLQLYAGDLIAAVKNNTTFEQVLVQLSETSTKMPQHV